MDKRRWSMAAGVAIAVVVVVIGAVVLLGGDDDDERTATRPGTSTTRPTTSEPTTTASTTTSASTTAPPTTAPVPTSASTTPPPGGTVPAVVTGVSAGPGGGSGEVALDWDAVAGATGYRVVRSDAPDGRFDRVADLSVVTGATTAGPGIANIWTEHHGYLPAGAALTGPDPSPQFHLVDFGGAARRCFRVVAYDAAGEGPASAPACGSPP